MGPLEKLEQLLERWSREHSDVLTLERLGTSGEGRPLYAAILTDPSVAAEQKEHALISALHSGVERSATATIFYLMEWLLSGDPRAAELLRRQVIVCLPLPNPDCYVEGRHGDVYSHWTLEGPADSSNLPEAKAVQTIMDRYQPEVHGDIHGIAMNFERYIMIENSGSSYSNLASRSYHREIIRLMDEAALAEGFPSDFQEADAERIVWGPELEAMAAKLWIGRPRVYASIYCYNRYHTLLSAAEVTWERSGFLRHRRLLEVGNEIWPGEYYPGYPTRVILANNYHMVVAYGSSAGERRRSRVELWNRLDQLTLGMADPFVEGKLMCVCATSAEARSGWLEEGTLADFAQRIGRHPGIDGQSIGRFVEGWPPGQNRPEAFVTLTGGKSAGGGARKPVEHGLGLRLRLFYDKARVTDLRLNGDPLQPSEIDGYVTWVSRGFTYIQINIPPQRTRAEDLFVVTCRYDPGERRDHWTGWQ